MSYEEFRRRIDTARQILVGAVPSPAGQIDQITYALMYKFMNDIDDEAAALGGKRSYFVGDYAKFNWHELMSTQLGAHERLELYREAIQTMAKNENIPELFRSIYQNAFLPFNSANVLTLFLKEIDKFSHGESDDIGDAYEYLLSITGAQGDVGQFRTPRHIIKFIVEAVNPTKDDKVLDPAVGTAGFLIAAYNHVKSQHDGKTESGERNDEKRLSADELHKIHHNYRGFDIDPTMVRTAKINMYLHGFKTPDIINHDSLSSEEYWNDWYDVILANPPFMTPKGGIQPHKKFSITANRAEVLFVDYIASHLKPNGRAGIVVPEGIIFQSGKAYKELRKNLVENSLYAVVSLPSGIFMPYTGVKTSILLLDKDLARQRDDVLFINIEHVGVSLGATGKRIDNNNLPEALDTILRFKDGEDIATSSLAFTATKSEIRKSNGYDLKQSLYRVLESLDHNVEFVSLESVADIKKGKSSSTKTQSGKYPLILTAADAKTAVSYDFDGDGVAVPLISALGHGKAEIKRIHRVRGKFALANLLCFIEPKKTDIVDPDYLFYVLDAAKSSMAQLMSGAANVSMSITDVQGFKIPLPPIEIQREIVAELDGYQKIIDAAQTIVQTYKPTIKINPEWEISTIGDVCDVGSSKRVFEKDWKTEGVPFYRAREIVSLAKDGFVENKLFISEEMFDEYSRKYGKPEAGDIMVTGVGTLGVTYLVKDTDRFYFKDGNIIWMKNFSERCSSAYLERLFTTDFIKNQIKAQAAGGTVGTYTISAAKNTKIPLPPIEIQREIVAELEAERQLINANKKLIEIYQQKIKSKIAEVWGD